MTDIDMIAGLRPEIPLPELDDLAPARGRLIDAIAAEHATTAGPPAPELSPARPASWRSRMRPASRRRLALTGLGTAVAAVAAGAGLLATSGGPAAPAMVPATINAAAAHVLNLAATAALRQPGGPPRADQFVYHAIRDGQGHLYQSWLSVNGTRNGLVRGIGGGTWAYVAGCRDGRAQVIASPAHGGTKGRQHCTPDPAYLPGVPTSPGKMAAYLERTQHVTIGDTVADVDMLGKAIDDLLGASYLAPRQMAAMYDFMANTPGFTVIPAAADATGRHGVGIRWQVSDGQAIAPGDTAMIIFDPHTGAYLGDRTIYRGESPKTYSGEAVIKVAIVNRIGQLP